MVNKKVRDLISINPIEPVIMLSWAEREDKPIADWFVITDETYNILKTIENTINQDNGSGFFIYGMYGTGKSHLLAYIFLSLMGKTKDFNFSQYKILPIPISLQNFSSIELLQDIIFTSIEKKLDIKLIPSEEIIHHFNRYYLEKEQRFFSKYDLTPQEWALIVEKEKNKALSYIKDYVIENRLPLKISIDIKKSMDIIMETLKEKGYNGLFLIVDELSEFLKASKRENFRDNIRFLQFLGEYSKNEKLFSIFALQESIEETGYIDRDAISRIKDRFPYRFRLSKLHIETIVSKRLFTTKDKNGIEKVISLYKEYYPDVFKAEKERYIKLYPLHPLTTKYLDGISFLFSRKRGAIEFIHSTGKKIEDENAIKLISPYMIFDHFRLRIIEQKELVEYDTFFKYAEEEIYRLFLEENLREIALNIIKLLIVNEISKFKKPLKLVEIASTLGFFKESSLAEVNLFFLKEKLILPMQREIGYISYKELNNIWEDEVSLDIRDDKRLWLKSEVEKRLKGIDIENKWEELLVELSNNIFPFFQYIGGDPIKKEIIWSFHKRQGRVYMMDIKNFSLKLLEKEIKHLKNTEDDFSIFIFYPSKNHDFLEAQIGRFNIEKEPIAYFTFSPISEEKIKKLNLFLAYKDIESSLLKESKKDLTKIEYIKSYINKYKKEAQRIIEEAIVSGNLYTDRKTYKKPFAYLDPNLNGIIENIGKDILDRIYPERKKLLVGDTNISSSEFEKLFKEFLVPMEITKDRAAIQGILPIINNIMLKLRLAVRKKDTFYISSDLENAKVVKEILKIISSQNNQMLFKELYLKIRKSPISLEKKLFELIIAVMLRSGIIVPYYKGKKIAFDNIRKLREGLIDEVRIPEFNISQYSNILKYGSFIWGKKKGEKEILSSLKNFIKDLKDIYSKVTYTLKEIDTYNPISFLKENETIKKEIAYWEGFFQTIEEDLSEKEAFLKFIEILKEQKNNFSIKVERLKKLEKFLSLYAKQIEFYYNYLSTDEVRKFYGEEIDLFLKSLHSRLIENIFSEDITMLIKDMITYTENYKNAYIKFHEKYYKSDIFQFISQKYIKLKPILEALINKKPSINIQKLINLLKENLPCNLDVKKELWNSTTCRCKIKLNSSPPKEILEEYHQLKKSIEKELDLGKDLEEITIEDIKSLEPPKKAIFKNTGDIEKLLKGKQLSYKEVINIIDNWLISDIEAKNKENITFFFK